MADHPNRAHTVVAHFDVTGWDVQPPFDADDAGPDLVEVEIHKQFAGPMAGTSRGRGLFCGLADPADGAGYQVTERFDGTIDGRAGTVVLQHVGIMAPGEPPHASGVIVPGSGTGALEGLRGEVGIGRDEDGSHTLTLHYDL